MCEREAFCGKRVVNALVDFREDRYLLKHHNGENGHALLIVGEIEEARQAYDEKMHVNLREEEYADVAIFSINELLVNHDIETVIKVIEELSQNSYAEADQWEDADLMSLMGVVGEEMRESERAEEDNLMILINISFYMIAKLHPGGGPESIMQAMMEKIGHNNAQHPAVNYQVSDQAFETLESNKKINYSLYKFLINEMYEEARRKSKKEARSNHQEELFIYGKDTAD